MNGLGAKQIVLIFNQLQRPRIAPANTGRIRGNTTKIALEGIASLSFDEKGFLRTGGPAKETHIVRLTTCLDGEL